MTKNIIWVNQFKLKESDKDNPHIAILGGAEVTISKHMKYLREQGHTVEFMTPLDFDRNKIDACDLVILSNVVWDKKKGAFNLRDLDYIVDTKPYVTFSHDAQYCMYRNPDCMDGGTSLRCPIKLCRDSVNLHWWKKAFKNSKLNVFLSPLQVNDAKFFFWNELSDDRTVCIPPPIKKSDMSPSPTAVIKGTYCVIGAIYPGKGIADILDNYKELGKNLRFIGSANHAGLVKRIVENKHTLVPPVTHKQMANILQKYEHIIISRRIKMMDNKGNAVIDENKKPRYHFMKEGFSRIIMEAINCGVNVICDKDSKKKIGFYSYNKSNEEMSVLCDNAEKQLHDELKTKELV